MLHIIHFHLVVVVAATFEEYISKGKFLAKCYLKQHNMLFSFTQQMIAFATEHCIKFSWCCSVQFHIQINFNCNSTLIPNTL